MSSRKDTRTVLRDLPPLLAAAVLPIIPIISQAGFLAAIPLLALIIPLLLGHFPGERVIERLAKRRPTRARAPRRLASARSYAITVPGLLRSRLLMAASFAKRPPPALSPAS